MELFLGGIGQRVTILHVGKLMEYFNFAVDVVDRWAASQPQGFALWCLDPATGGQTKFNFRQLSRLSHQAANFFQTQGVRKGMAVLVLLHRVPEWWICMLGLIRLGAVPIPGTTQLTTRDLKYRIEAARVGALVTDADGAAKAEDFPGLRFAVSGGVEGWIDFRDYEQAETVFSGPTTLADDPGIIYFTSATTGEPKMVLHSQASYGLGHEVTGKLWLDLQPGDVLWNVSDVGWAKAAWSSLFGPWHGGACVFAVNSRGRFEPVAILKILAEYPISVWCAPPTALRLIIREDLGRWRFPYLRHCVTAGEPLNPEVFRAWKKATGLTIHEGYGQSETVVLVGNFRSLGQSVKPGSMGKATPGYPVVLVDENLREVGGGEEGEIALRLEPERPLGLFREYLENPPANEAHFQRGYYLTGDRATRDADGYFWFVGRKDDIIKCAGYRIGPGEVENALLEHPAVLEVAVIGKPDPIRGQIVKAFVILRPGSSPCQNLEHELQQHCKALIAPYKYPREIEFVDELPKTISGKTRRNILRSKS